MTTFELTMNRLSLSEGHVVFSPPAEHVDGKIVFPRPKVTLDIDQWETLGRPMHVEVQVEARERVMV